MAFQERIESDNEFILSTKIVHTDGSYMIIIVFYAPPDQKQRAIVYLTEELRYLSLRYKQLPLLIMGDFNYLPNDKIIINLCQ